MTTTLQPEPSNSNFVSHSPATQQGGGADIELCSLRNGVSLTQVANNIRPERAADQDRGGKAAASTRWLVANTRVYGGAAIQGVGSADVTAFLPAGTIYAVDVNSVFSGGRVYSKGPAHLRPHAPRLAGRNRRHHQHDVRRPRHGDLNVPSTGQLTGAQPLGHAAFRRIPAGQAGYDQCRYH